MLFNSYEFIFFFLPIVILGYFLLGKKGTGLLSKVCLLLASLFFYSYWNPIYLPLLLSSILFNYCVSGIIINNRTGIKTILSSKLAFRLGICINIILLCFFKYMDFFIDNINVVIGSHFSLLHIVLPLGISFFTITQMVYLVDTYEGLVRERNIVDYSLFVTFFPHLLAGPILHHKPIMAQFANVLITKINYENIYRGLILFVIGLFKKVIFADSLAPYVKIGFSNPEQLTFLNGWLTILGYGFQLYFDFSGYSDMAVGIALIFNINIPINFNSPFKATNIIDFWKRWHISLTNVITTYLYTPILKSFSTITFNKAMFATFMAMLLAGLWHGANWTFIIFGAMHGFGMVVNHIWKKRKLKMKTSLARCLTMLWVFMAWVFFRADNVTEAIIILKTMFGFNDIWTIKNWAADYRYLLKLCIVCGLVVYLVPNSNELIKKIEPNWKWVLVIGCMLALGILSLNNASEFLYFQF